MSQVINMDVDEAWEHFIKSDTSFVKASDSGKLDTISAQIQELSTDIKRVTDIIPQIQGDRNVLDDEGGGSLDTVLGGESPESILAGVQGDEGDQSVPEEEGEESAPPEEPMEKAVDDDTDTEELQEEVSEDAPSVDVPDDRMQDHGNDIESEPEPGEDVDVSVEVDDVVPDEEVVESIEPAGQEGLPPEGVPDLTDEINATQPDGLLNVYDRFIEGMRAAAHEAVESGQIDKVTRIAGAQDAIDSIWRSQIAPLVGGGERFTRSADSRIVKSEIGDMTGERMSDEIASSHEVSLNDCSEEGAENTTGHDNDAKAPDTPCGEVGDTDAPHALNNDTTTVDSSDPASFEKAEETEPVEKCDSVEKSAEPVADGEGMEPVTKSLEDLEGYSEDYVDKDPDLDYTDPIRKSVPSFKEIMAVPKEERFMRMAEMRHGPHKTMEQFLKSWHEEDMRKSMTEGAPMAGTDPVQGSATVMKAEGAPAAGDAGVSNAVFSEPVEKSMAGEPGPVGNVQDAMQPVEKSAEDQLNDVNAGFEKATAETTPVGDELQGPVDDRTSDTGMEDVDSAMKKSQANGKRIMSFNEMLSFRKSGMPTVSRPGPESTVNGDVTPTELRDFRKSQSPVVRMGRGVDHRDVVRADWEEYRLYKNQGRF